MKIHAHRIGLALTLASSLLGMAVAGCGSSSSEETLSAGETATISGTDRQFTCRDGQRVFAWTRNSDNASQPFVTVLATVPGQCATDAGVADAAALLDSAASD